MKPWPGETRRTAVSCKHRPGEERPYKAVADVNAAKSYRFGSRRVAGGVSHNPIRASWRGFPSDCTRAAGPTPLDGTGILPVQHRLEGGTTPDLVLRLQFVEKRLNLLAPDWTESSLRRTRTLWTNSNLTHPILQRRIRPAFHRSAGHQHQSSPRASIDPGLAVESPTRGAVTPFGAPFDTRPRRPRPSPPDEAKGRQGIE